ncbi:54S ribosomal protein L8, mitochondrial [Dimargaris xerosporica]|nr:54S ribosomal protein L8, mitochondrial [Dimargaris xerosporica]
MTFDNSIRATATGPLTAKRATSMSENKSAATMEERLRLWRETKTTAKQVQPDAHPAKSARTALQVKAVANIPSTMASKKFATDKTGEQVKALTKKVSDLTATTQQQHSRILDLEARLHAVADTMVPKEDMDAIVSENLRLQQELEEQNALLVECQEALEATEQPVSADGSIGDLSRKVAEQECLIRQLEDKVMILSFPPDIGSDGPTAKPNRKRSYEELQSAFDEVVEENERLHKRIAVLEPLAQMSTGVRGSDVEKTELDLDHLQRQATAAINQFKMIQSANEIMYFQMTQNKARYELELRELRENLLLPDSPTKAPARFQAIMLTKPKSSLGKTWAYRLSMFRNMTTSLIKYGRIETTVPKAKELRRMVDKMIYFGKRGDKTARIRAQKILTEPKFTFPKVFGELAERYQDRTGGFTRMTRIGWRKGDHAPMAVVELIGGEHDLRYQTLVRTLARKQYDYAHGPQDALPESWSYILKRSHDSEPPATTADKSPISTVQAVLQCPTQLVVPETRLSKQDFIRMKKLERSIANIKAEVTKVLRSQQMVPEQLQAKIDEQVETLRTNQSAATQE